MNTQETVEEKRNSRIGMITTISIHLVLLVAFIFLIAWKEQIPPPEPIGMSINFGTSNEGSGNEQPLREQTEQQEVVEETEQAEQVQEETTPPQEQSQEVTDPVETTESVTDAVQKEGPVKVEEKKVEETPKEEIKPPTETKSDPVEEVEEKKEERKLEAVYTGPKTNETNTSTNQGTKDNTKGDQGSEEGNLDSRSMYGGPGSGGGGFSHNFTGWGTDFRLPEDKPEATGVLEFKITIDDRGDVVKIRTTKMIGNPEAEKFYADLITKQMKFYRTSNQPIPPFSEGTITLNLKVK